MPFHWVRISTGTPSRLKPYLDDPQGFERELDAIVSEAGGGVDATFFSTDGRSAYVLIHDPGNRVDVARLETELSDERGKPDRIELESPEERSRRNPKS